MKKVHVECRPDELLISKLGFTRKMIVHHQGKSRVFHTLSKNKGLLAMVDEDPGSAKTRYEKSLHFKEEFEGIKYFYDKSGNKVFILKGKLEDWIIWVCKKQKVNLTNFKLPNKPNDLHDVINYKLQDFSRLIDELIKLRSPAVLKLRAWLN